jgi:hypothetical protein
MRSTVSDVALTKITAETAAETCQRFEMGEEARALLGSQMAPRDFLDVLVQAGHYVDAARFLAYAVPKREAVWWACQCARAVASAPPPPVAEALRVAEKWVADPTEENRRLAKAAADAAQLSTPAGCAALAAFLSGGSLAPPEVESAVPPAEDLTAKVVAGAILLAAVTPPPDRAPERFREFLGLGRQVAAGINRW